MANYLVVYKIQVTDVNGDSALVSINSLEPDTHALSVCATGAANLSAALAACTNGKVTSQGISVTFVKAQISAGTAPPPANATYPSVTDGAQINFSNSIGERRKLTIPAPLLSDFITNSNKVNPADASVAAMIAIVEGLVDLNGSTNLYEGGIKVGKHSRKRRSIKSL